MTSDPFESYAQNGEDVVLWRALRGIPSGRYVDVGANDPVVDSISWPFYLQGWTGITVEPVATLMARHRAQRPEDIQVEAVVGELNQDEVTFYEIPSSGLSTIDAHIAARHKDNGWAIEQHQVPVRGLDDILAEARWNDEPIHFMTIDTEGSEAAVLASMDLRRWRPWVLVVEATAPTSARPTHQEWEPGILNADYELRLFDGLSRFYVAREHSEELGPALSYSACALDNYTTYAYRQRVAECEAARAEADAEKARAAELAGEASRWRNAAIIRWAELTQSGASGGEVAYLNAELARMRETVSWRVTKPLRLVRTQIGMLRAGR